MTINKKRPQAPKLLTLATNDRKRCCLLRAFARISDILTDA
jgi:hypothetical protein